MTKRSAFTLIEVLVMSIITTLAAVLLAKSAQGAVIEARHTLALESSEEQIPWAGSRSGRRFERPSADTSVDPAGVSLYELRQLRASVPAEF